MITLRNALWVLIAYLVGSIPTAHLIGKQIRGIDIREHGSGNVGATNAFRVLGKGWGTLVLVIDILKGWVVTAILAPTSGTFPELAVSLRQVFFGIAAILGHTWSPWLKLKGGKGMATSAGALLGIFPLAALVGTFVWAVTFAVWRYVSLASIIAAACFPFLLLLFHRQLESFALIFAISFVLAALLIYNHRANIERIKRGEEPRVPFGKTPTP